jgi:transcriptional regulator with XRE-family HTH domain
MKAFGLRLKELRERVNLTQGQFAKRLGKASNMIVSRWERGLTFPRIDELESIAQVLGCQVADFFPGESPERSKLEREFLDLIGRIQAVDPNFQFNVGREAPAMQDLTDVQVRAIAGLLTTYLKSLSK